MSRILNRRELANVPMVDAGHLYLGEVPENIEAKRAKLRWAQIRHAQARRNAEVQARERARIADQRAIRDAQLHGDMLARSLSKPGHDIVHAAVNQGTGWTRQYGNGNPLMGFVDETAEPDFEMRDTYPAQEFNNHLTANTNINYTRFKDYPLVMDAPRGDFGGVLTNDTNSADFSEYIVNEVKTDFGYVPKARLRRR